MLNANDELADLTIERALVLNRYSSGAGRDVVNMLAFLERDIIKRLPDVTGTDTRARMLKQIKKIQEIIGNTYSEIYKLTTEDLTRIAELEAKWQIDSVNHVAGFDIATGLPSDEVLKRLVNESLIVGNTSEQWWQQQSEKLQNDFQRAVQTGMAQSETNQQITKRFRDVSGLAQRNAFALVKTATHSVAIQARHKTMEANSDVVKGKMSLATLDSHTTLVCAVRDHAKYDLENLPIEGTKAPYIAIPRHMNCRSWETFILKSFSEITGIPGFESFKGSTRASMDGQISRGTTFEKFLEGKSKEWQDEYLGTGKAELFRAGKITLSDMVSGTGRELTLDQLRKY
jgi:hypothetical protein